MKCKRRWKHSWRGIWAEAAVNRSGFSTVISFSRCLNATSRLNSLLYRCAQVSLCAFGTLEKLLNEPSDGGGSGVILGVFA